MGSNVFDEPDLEKGIATGGRGTNSTGSVNNGDLEKTPSNGRSNTDMTMWEAQNSPIDRTSSTGTGSIHESVQSAGSIREPKHRKRELNSSDQALAWQLIRICAIVDCAEKSYRTMATFLDSDENFMIYRRFGYLHARTLLRLQDRLRVLEALLDSYDTEDAQDEDQSKKQLLISRRKDEADCRKRAQIDPDESTRTQILDEIEEVLARYGMNRKLFKSPTKC